MATAPSRRRRPASSGVRICRGAPEASSRAMLGVFCWDAMPDCPDPRSAAVPLAGSVLGLRGRILAAAISGDEFLHPVGAQARPPPAIRYAYSALMERGAILNHLVRTDRFLIDGRLRV